MSETTGVVRRRTSLDRYLTIWIFLVNVSLWLGRKYYGPERMPA